jgi:RNA polymerase sigma-70 factor (ECF subfamily)
MSSAPQTLGSQFWLRNSHPTSVKCACNPAPAVRVSNRHWMGLEIPVTHTKQNHITFSKRHSNTLLSTQNPPQIFWNSIPFQHEYVTRVTAGRPIESMTKGQALNDDVLLLQRILDGDEEAFTLLYRRKHPAIFRFALHMSGNSALAEDVTQEVFMTLIRDASRFDPERGTLGGFLYGIARNHLRRRWEQDRNSVPLPETADELDVILTTGPAARQINAGANVTAFPAPRDEFAAGECVARVRQAISTLPENYREVVVLCELDELSYEAAAELLECPVGTVRSRLHRAKSILMEKLREPRPTRKISAMGRR